MKNFDFVVILLTLQIFTPIHFNIPFRSCFTKEKLCFRDIDFRHLSEIVNKDRLSWHISLSFSFFFILLSYPGGSFQQSDLIGSVSDSNRNPTSRARRFHIFWNRKPNRIRNILVFQIRNRNRNREIETDRTGTETVGTEKFFSGN